MIAAEQNIVQVYEIIITILVAVTGFAVTMLIRIMMKFNKKVADLVDKHTEEIQELRNTSDRHTQAFHVCKFYHHKQHNEDMNFNRLLDP